MIEVILFELMLGILTLGAFNLGISCMEGKVKIEERVFDRTLLVILSVIAIFTLLLIL